MASFRMNITGIVAFVPDETQSRVGVVVVDTARSSNSGERLFDDLVPHMPILKYRARDEQGATSPELLGTRWAELDMRGKRLYFEFGARADELELDLFGVPPIEEAFEHATMDTSVLSGASPFVHAQLDLGAGKVFSSPDAIKKWAFKRNWKDDGAELALGGKSVWEVDDVDRVRIVLTPIDGSQGGDEITLVPRGGSDIELELSNECPNPPERPSDWRQMADVDFRWHYELLDRETKTAARERLQHQENIPIPYPLENPLEVSREAVAGGRRFATDTMCLQALFAPARLGWPREAR